MAFDGDIVRQLPILCSDYTNLQELRQSAEESAKDKLKGEDASDQASGWISDLAPSAGNSIGVRIPLPPPFYVCFGIDIDFFKAKKIGVYMAMGADIEYDVINEKSSLNKSMSEQQSFKVSDN